MSGKPFPDPSHECAGEPILDAWTHQAIRRYPGATSGEITEKVLGIARWTDAYDRRMAAARVREIMGEPALSPPAHDSPRPTGAVWEWIVQSYRSAQTDPADEPPQATVAGKMNNHSEQWLRDQLRPLGIKDWRDVHALIATEPKRARP